MSEQDYSNEILDIWKGRQSLNLKETKKIGTRVYRVVIHSDSYDFQSYTRISRYDIDSNQWTILDSISGHLMKTKYKPQDLDKSVFQEDYDEIWARLEMYTHPIRTD